MTVKTQPGSSVHLGGPLDHRRVAPRQTSQVKCRPGLPRLLGSVQHYQCGTGCLVAVIYQLLGNAVRMQLLRACLKSFHWWMDGAFLLCTWGCHVTQSRTRPLLLAFTHVDLPAISVFQPVCITSSQHECTKI